MPKGVTRKIPNRQQRTLRQIQSHYSLQIAMANLTPDEYSYFQRLLTEAGNPDSLTDRAAILDRAVAHVANQVLADNEAHKTPEQHRKELFG